jgi:RNA polymerase sigma-70 factor, ECF subfamily
VNPFPKQSKPDSRSVPPTADVATPSPARSAGIELSAREGFWRQYLEEAAKGDEQAFAGLYDESSGLVYSVALRILGNEADAEEVTLEVYTHIWKYAKDFDAGRGTVCAWLAMLARSRAIDRLRAGASRRTCERELPAAFAIIDPGILPDEAGEASERRRFVQAALETLSAEQREAIELAYFSGLSHSELAARLGRPLGTVKTRIRLAMMKLRALLEPLA